jgi:hypothetical protein
MAQKSSLYEYFWWIPTKELGDSNPTAFLVCGLSKGDKDRISHRNMNAQVLATIARMPDKDSIPDRVRSALESVQTEEGFDANMYGKCIKEIKNIYVKGELVESLVDKNEIIKAIEGLVDEEVSAELDDVIWNRSDLTEVEAQNFTPSSGCNSVFQTKAEKNPSEA